MKALKVGLPLVLMFLAFGCSRRPESGRFLASASGSKLYMNDVAARVDTNSAYAVRNYVSNWVDQQLLYDEAGREGLDNTPGFRERVKEFSRQLAITSLLNKKVYDVPIDLAPQEISDFYAAHSGEFRASNDMVRVNLTAFDKRNFAVAFRNALVSGTSWSAAFHDIPMYAILDEKDSVYLKASNTKAAIWTVVQSLDAGRISFPIQVDSLSYIVQVIQKIKPGDPLPLDYASSLIKERITIEKRRQLYRDLLNSLRSSGNFQIDPSVAVRDTSVKE